MSEEEFQEIENPTYLDFEKRYGEFASFMYNTQSYDDGNLSSSPLAMFVIIFGLLITVFAILMASI